MGRKIRLSPNKLAEIKSSFAGLKTIPDYKPIKAEFEVNLIQAVETTVDELTLQEAQLSAQLGDVRDQLADKGTEFTQKMKGAAQQVIAQYGDDSAEIQMLGTQANFRTGDAQAEESHRIVLNVLRDDSFYA